MAEAARQGAIENVRTNLPAIQDTLWVRQIETQIQALDLGQ
jgi:formiminotetrahydrofolate cyclodeaminase